MKINHLLILGANSGMAEAVAYEAAARGIEITLAGRSEEKLIALKSDLVIKHGTAVHYVLFDATDTGGHAAFYQALSKKPDAVLCAFGILGDQQEAEKNWTACETIIQSNFTGAVSILNIIASDFAQKGKGIIAGISSVAGERGRQSNYIYGAAKAGFTTYLSGLRNSMYHAGVHVVTVKPGFVKTKMLAGLNTPNLLTAKPEDAGRAILKAMIKKQNTLYYKSIWQLVMYIIKSIPESIFKRLKM